MTDVAVLLPQPLEPDMTDPSIVNALTEALRHFTENPDRCDMEGREQEVAEYLAAALPEQAELHRLRREINAVRAACDKRGDQVTATWQILDEIEAAIGYTSRDPYTLAETGEQS